MNVFIFFFLTTAVVTAAPPHAASTSDKHKSGKPVNSTNHECHKKSPEEKKPDQYLLRDIINNGKGLKSNLTKEILQKKVQDVFMNGECNCEILCKAGKVLSAYNASDLGLKTERDWRLPRMLHAYSKNCTNTDKLDNIPLRQLLDKIHSCAQKEYANY